jgi:hypothetical protein
VLASNVVQEFGQLAEGGDNLEPLAGRAWSVPTTWRWRPLRYAGEMPVCSGIRKATLDTTACVVTIRRLTRRWIRKSAYLAADSHR